MLLRIPHMARRLPGAVDGNAAIEFALLAPLLFAILFAMVTLGVQYAARIALTYAAAEGGRAAVGALQDSERENDATNAINRTLEALSPLVDPQAVAIAFAKQADDGGERFTVNLTYSDNRFAVMPFVPAINNGAPVSVSYFITDPSG